MINLLEFPKFLVNTVVPGRHARKRWGTPEGEQEGESPPLLAQCILDTCPFLHYLLL